MNQRELHRAVLEQAALYFGWNNFDHYKKARSRNAKKLVNQVYHMSMNEKENMLQALKNKDEHDAYEADFGKIIIKNN